MSIAWLAFTALLVATVALGTYMARGIVPRIEEAAGGRKILDRRPGGYDFAETERFLNALTPEAANTYLKMARGPDSVLPLFYGLAFYVLMHCVTPQTFPVPAEMLGFIAVPAVVSDLRENTIVAGMLKDGPDRLTPDVVARASFWTRWKWRLLALMAGITVMMIAVRLFWSNGQAGLS